MKNKAVFMGMAALLITSASLAQVENDDMYFNSKDRAKLRAAQAQDEANYQAALSGRPSKRNNERTTAIEEDVNPTDSYSARNENPEFAARSNSEFASEDNQDYFVSDYRYANTNKINNWNSSFNNWYGNNWYTPNYYSSSIYGWNSPYYGSYYDSWGSPWMNPYYGSGWSSSFSFHMGNSWNYGWGGYGMGMAMNPYLNSWYGWGSPYGMGMGSAFGYGYGGGYGWGGGWGGYPSTIVVINNGEGGGRNVVYGKRGSSRGSVVTRQEALNSRTRTSVANTSGNVRPSGNTGGRVATNNGGSYNNNYPTRNTTRTSQPQADYYNRGDRSVQRSGSGSYSQPSRGSWSNPGNSNSGSGNTGFRGGNDNWSRGSNNNSSNQWNNNSNSGSRSFDNGGGRSSSPASGGGSVGGGGGSNGRTRGRN